MIEVKEQLRDVEAVCLIDGQSCVVAGHPQIEYIKEYILPQPQENVPQRIPGRQLRS